MYSHHEALGWSPCREECILLTNTSEMSIASFSDEEGNQVMPDLSCSECSSTALMASKMFHFSPEWIQTGLTTVTQLLGL